MNDLDTIMKANIAALKKRYAGLKITAKQDTVNSKIMIYLFHSPDRDVYLRLTTPTGQDVSIASKWHEPIARFYDRHQLFLNGELGDSNTTGSVNSLIY